MLPSEHMISHDETGHSISFGTMGFSQHDNSIPRSHQNSVTTSHTDIGHTPLQIEDSLLVLHLINLETSGLWRSPRLSSLNPANNDPAIAIYTTYTMPLLSRQIMRLRPRLLFISVFNSVGSLWTYATPNNHSDNEHFPLVAHFSNDIKQSNSLFDNTINEICHQIQACTTLKES